MDNWNTKRIDDHTFWLFRGNFDELKEVSIAPIDKASSGCTRKHYLGAADILINMKDEDENDFENIDEEDNE
jgi:hypothetical protein